MPDSHNCGDVLFLSNTSHLLDFKDIAGNLDEEGGEGLN